MPQRPRDLAGDFSPGPSCVASHPAQTLAAPVLRFDLCVEAGELRRQDSYTKRRPTGRTLVKEHDLRIVLLDAALRYQARGTPDVRTHLGPGT